jgi:hypothetical protein
MLRARLARENRIPRAGLGRILGRMMRRVDVLRLAKECESKGVVPEALTDRPRNSAKGLMEFATEENCTVQE